MVGGGFRRANAAGAADDRPGRHDRAPRRRTRPQNRRRIQPRPTARSCTDFGPGSDPATLVTVDATAPRDVRGDSEHPLHLDDVEPLAELAADLPFGAHDLETARRVQLDRCVVVADDASDDRVETVYSSEADQARRAHGARCVGPDTRRAGTRSLRRSSSTPVGPETSRATRIRPLAHRRRPRSRDGRLSARRSTAPARRSCGARGRRSTVELFTKWL